MGAAAHLIHGSSDGRFSIAYAVKDVTCEEIYYIPNPALGLWINREKF